MKILTVAWLVYDDRIPEFANNFTGGGVIIRDLCEELGKSQEAYLFIGQRPLKGRRLGKCTLIDTLIPGVTAAELTTPQPGYDYKEQRLNLMCEKFDAVLSELKPDIVNFHGLGEFFYRCFSIVARHNIPFALTDHLYIGKIPDFTGYSESVLTEKKLFESGLVKNYITVSTGMKRKILHDYPQISEDSIKVILNGVALSGAQASYNIREKYNISVNKKILLCVGTILDRKNQLQVVRAFNLLPQSVQEKITVIFCGRDSMKGALQKAIKESGLEDSLLYAGPVPSDELPSYYTAAKGIVMPSYAEGLSISALEAIAFGLPVILYKDSECAEDLADPHVVCFPEKRSDECLSKAIVNWANTNWNCEDIKQYSKRFSMKDMAENYILYYNGLIREARKDI